MKIINNTQLFYFARWSIKKLCEVTFPLDRSEVWVDWKFPLFIATMNKAEKFEMVVARCSWNVHKQEFRNSLARNIRKQKTFTGSKPHTKTPKTQTPNPRDDDEKHHSPQNSYT